MKIFCIIPARYKSSRLEGKPLLKIGNSSLIQRVTTQVKKCRYIDKLIVASDSTKVLNELDTIEVEKFLSIKKANCGTDRIKEITDFYSNSIEDTDIILNIQGDMPFINPIIIDSFIYKIKTLDTHSAYTIAIPIKKDNIPLYFSKNKSIVKVEYTIDNKSINFYRKLKTSPLNKLGHHIGIYAYTYSAFKEFTSFPITKNEIILSLEQIRYLDNQKYYYIYEIDPNLSIFFKECNDILDINDCLLNYKTIDLNND